MLYINQAIKSIENIPSKIISQSRILETKALEITNQPDFLNCILFIETALPPLDLLNILQQIETKIGRVKRYDKGRERLTWIF